MKKLTLAIFCSLTLAFGCLGGSESEENNDQHSNDTYSYDESSGPDNQADLNTLDMSIFKEMDRSAPAPETEQEMRELYGWVEGVWTCDSETNPLCEKAFQPDNFCRVELSVISFSPEDYSFNYGVQIGAPSISATSQSYEVPYPDKPPLMWEYYGLEEIYRLGWSRLYIVATEDPDIYSLYGYYDVDEERYEAFSVKPKQPVSEDGDHRNELIGTINRATGKIEYDYYETYLGKIEHFSYTKGDPYEPYYWLEGYWDCIQSESTGTCPPDHSEFRIRENGSSKKNGICISGTEVIPIYINPTDNPDFFSVDNANSEVDIEGYADKKKQELFYTYRWPDNEEKFSVTFRKLE